MTDPTPCGAWPSPITANLVVQASVRLGDVQISRADDGTETIWWSEQRPDEGGRTQLVRREPDGSLTEVLPRGVSAASHVHEYGGGGWWLGGTTVYFSNDADQRIWRLDAPRG